MSEKKLGISSKKFRGDSSVVSVRLPNDMIEKLDVIAEQTASDVISVVGTKFVLYRRSEKKQRIFLDD